MGSLDWFAALAVLLAGLSAVEAGWPTIQVLTALAAAGALALGFVVADGRSSAPLLPGWLVRRRAVLAANAVTLTMSAVVLGVNFFLAVHLQQRLGLSPVQTGLAFLPITVASACTAMGSARLVQRTGPRPLLVVGMVSISLGALWLSRLPDQGLYASAVLPGMLLVAAGMGPGFAIGLAGLGVLAGGQGGGGAGARAAFAAMTVLGLAAAAAAACLPGRARDGEIEIAVGPHAVHLPAQAAGCLPGCVPSAATVSPSQALPALRPPVDNR